MSEKLEQYLATTADDLPVMPAIAREIIRAVDDPDSCISDIKELIEQDSAIAAKLLKMSNSALYGFPSEINSITHAISLLGTRTVRKLVLAVSLKKTFRRFGEYEQVIQRVYNEKIGFVEAETERFGFDHTMLGGAIATRWNLPESLVSVIANHHNHGALAELSEEIARLTALTAVTSTCLTKLGVGRSEPVDGIDPAPLPGLELPRSHRRRRGVDPGNLHRAGQSLRRTPHLISGLERWLRLR
jgi:HD-like signal output (HDOD) protein